MRLSTSSSGPGRDATNDATPASDFPNTRTVTPRSRPEPPVSSNLSQPPVGFRGKFPPSTRPLSLFTVFRWDSSSTAMSSSPNNNNSPAPSTSRCERLLRNALLRDDLGSQLTNTHRTQSSSTELSSLHTHRPAHRRRHTHASLTPLPSTLTRASQTQKTCPPSSSHPYPHWRGQAQPRSTSRSSTPRPCLPEATPPSATSSTARSDGRPVPAKTQTKSTSSRASSPSPSHYSFYSHHTVATHSPLKPTLQLETTTSISYPQKRQSLPASFAHGPPSPIPSMPLPMTPPEQALRARLERVLLADAGASGSSKERERMTSMNEVRDEVDGWPWRRQFMANEEYDETASTTSSSFSHPHSPAYSHSKSRSPPSPSYPYSSCSPSKPATPRTPPTPGSAGINPRHALTQSAPLQLTISRQMYAYMPPGRAVSPCSHIATPPLTPPRKFRRSLSRGRVGYYTPPSPPDVDAGGGESDSECSLSASQEECGYPQRLPPPPGLSCDRDEREGKRRFNARKAAERLRMTEGYVSFASVEGLGVPPETPIEGPRELREDVGRGRKAWTVRGTGKGAAWIGWLTGGTAQAQA